jgi:hypothetical protein
VCLVCSKLCYPFLGTWGLISIMTLDSETNLTSWRDSWLNEPQMMVMSVCFLCRPASRSTATVLENCMSSVTEWSLKATWWPISFQLTLFLHHFFLCSDSTTLHTLVGYAISMTASNCTLIKSAAGLGELSHELEFSFRVKALASCIV